MKRRLFHAAAGVSIALSAAVVWLWIRSAQPYDAFVLSEKIGNRAYALSASSYRGVCCVSWQYATEQPGWKGRNPWGPRFKWNPWGYASEPYYQSLFNVSWRLWIGRFGVVGVNRLGFDSSSGTRIEYPAREYVVVFPHWAAAVALALPLAWAIARRPDRRAPLRRCRRCGYDLRGSESGTCPECGASRPASEVHAA